jgi:hypothetical protein
MTDPARFDTYLQVRLTTHDKERIKARALEAGLKTSEYVRKRALGINPLREVKRHPANSFERHLEANQLERNIRGSVEMQAPRNEP